MLKSWVVGGGEELSRERSACTRVSHANGQVSRYFIESGGVAKNRNYSSRVMPGIPIEKATTGLNLRGGPVVVIQQPAETLPLLNFSGRTQMAGFFTVEVLTRSGPVSFVLA
jgi:hypothetical protein